MNRASLDGTELPFAITPGINLKDLVLAGKLAPVIKPRGGVAGGEHRGSSENSHSNRLAAEVLDLKVPTCDITDELRFVIAFEWITKHKVLGHDPLQGRGIATHECLDPIIIHLSESLLDYEAGFRAGAHRGLTDTLLRQIAGRVKFKGRDCTALIS